MPKITALIHASNDARSIGRALDSLRPCDEVLVIDHGSADDTARIAREHGAKVKAAIMGVEDGAYVVDAGHDWILCLRPSEALSEALEASLFEWKQRDPGSAIGFSVAIRHETSTGWKNGPLEMRLVNHRRINWKGDMPPNPSKGTHLAGDLLQFRE